TLGTGNFILASSYVQHTDSQVSLANTFGDLEVSPPTNVLAERDQNVLEKGTKKVWASDLEKDQKQKNKEFIEGLLSVHPDTSEPIFLPFRMSCFVPTNLVVVAGMLMSNPSMKSIIFWQWVNQSINVAINYPLN
ncbi:2167_t:CDS:2, partial [Scutellospora calospora]